jgi:hypothetical protein
MTDAPDPIESFRGEFPSKTLNARRIAGALDAPGCHRRMALDASAVNIEKLGSFVTGALDDQQSPFAIARGIQFEQKVIANGMAEIVALAREHLNLEIPEVRQFDLSSAAVGEGHPGVKGARMNELRYRLTRQFIEDMLTHPDSAYNLIRHAMTRIEFAGQYVYLEQDMLAFAVKGRLHVVEIKSFPQVDGRADPVQASASLRQTAVYGLSLQDMVRDLGAPEDVVSTRAMLVLPRNLTFQAVAATHDISMEIRRLRRQLAAVPSMADILDSVPEGVRLPGLPEAGASDAEVEGAIRTAREALAVLTPRFNDGCISCPMFGHCRDEAERHGAVARLGNAVASSCGNVTTIDAAIDLRDGRRAPANQSEAAVANLLSRGPAAAALAARGRP